MSGPPRSCSRARTTCGLTKRAVRCSPNHAAQCRKDNSVDRHRIVTIMRSHSAEHVGHIIQTLQHEGVIEIEVLRLGVRWDVVRVGHFEYAPCLPAFNMRIELSEIKARPREHEWRC